MRTLITLLLSKLKELAMVLVVAVAICCAPILVIVILYAGLLLSVEVPSRFVDSGVQDFEGVKKDQARRFLSETEYLLIEISVMPEGALRVESVQKCPPGRETGRPDRRAYPGQGTASVLGGGARVRAVRYTEEADKVALRRHRHLGRSRDDAVVSEP